MDGVSGTTGGIDCNGEGAIGSDDCAFTRLLCCKFCLLSSRANLSTVDRPGGDAFPGNGSGDGESAGCGDDEAWRDFSLCLR